MFSQTGSEIVELSKRLGRWPDLILTNNKDKKKWHKELQFRSDVVKDLHDRLVKHIERQANITGENPFVTLHGYLRIMPDLPYEMLNGHPALCNRYPELKGKDPQELTWHNRNNYKFVGSIVHKVTSEVDGGELVKEVCYTNHIHTREDLDITLRRASLTAWTHVLEEKFGVRSN